ncbi:MAG: MATE family efflux transporter [Sphingomonadales bacterium]|nr:MAG: MATE family efflux transporter [Sphingomonadales bacterium]
MTHTVPPPTPAAVIAHRADKRAAMLKSGAIIPTLLLLTLPNLIALGSSAVVSIAETAYVGRIGVAALGGIALAFPIFMLMQMLSAGAMGGTISGAISRALGAGDVDAARGLARAAVMIAVTLGLTLAALVRGFGEPIFRALGGSGAVLDQALAFSNVATWAIPGIWLANTLSSILRGSGNMGVPAATLLAAGLVQVAVGGALGLGIGPLPRLGMQGVAIGQVTAFWTATLVLSAYLGSGRATVGLSLDAAAVRATHAAVLLRVGCVAMLSPLFSVGSVLVLTRLVAELGPEALAGYGIGVRLEFLLIPIAFSVGVASVPMVGTALGSGNLERARNVAWTSGGLAFAVLALIGIVIAWMPGLWANLFTDAAPVRLAAYTYLGIAGYGFGFFGLGLCLYFASQGAGRMGGVILAQAARFVVIVVGGTIVLGPDARAEDVFLLSAGAMIVMGLGTTLAVKIAKWR